METLLLHERRYWRRAADSRSLVLDDATAVGAVAATTLWTADTEADALAIVAAVHGLRDLSEDRRSAAAHWLADLYPAEGRFWGTLQPDRLGEYFVARTLALRPELLSTQVQVASQRQAEHALTVMTRAAPDHQHLTHTIRDAVLAAPATFGPAAVTSALQAAEPTPLLDALTALLAAPRPDDETAARLMTRLLAAVPSATHVLRQVAAEMAVVLTSIHRRLAETRPDAYLPDLAMSLNSLSNRLDLLGRREEALTPVEEAVTIRRGLAEAQPDAHLPDLAMSLNNLSNRLDALGRREEALAAVEEAATIHRRLA
jgi:hypothetical protein